MKPATSLWRSKTSTPTKRRTSRVPAIERSTVPPTRSKLHSQADNMAVIAERSALSDAPSASYLGIDAPVPCAREHKVKEHKAEKDRELTTVLRRKEAFWRVCHEVGYGHVTGEDEGNRTNEEANDDEKAANEFKYALKTHKREQGGERVLRRRKAQQLLRTMLK